MELVDVKKAATMLNVSETWIRRHQTELPVVRLGKLLRFDSALLSSKLEKSLKSEKEITMPSRYQRGRVFLRGKKEKVWYGVFREDVKTPEGIDRKQRKVRLGTLVELSTKNAARNKLAEQMKDSSPNVEMTFNDLADRWKKAVGPTLKDSTFSHYSNALRAYVLPQFKSHDISNITKEDIQLFLVDQAKKYSEPSLRSMRVVIGLVLGWAVDNGWLEKNPCTKISLPKATGKKIERTTLTSEQVTAIADKLEEPYATLVVFLYATGLRIGEAVGLKWSDFDNNVFTVNRRIYDGEVGTPKTAHSVRSLPVDKSLLQRMQNLNTTDWVFTARNGSPINPGNALKRYLKPMAKELGISLAGWHDFRHSLTTQMRRNGVHPKIVSGILGHSKVDLAMNVYDHVDVSDFQQPLQMVSQNL